MFCHLKTTWTFPSNFTYLTNLLNSVIKCIYVFSLRTRCHTPLWDNFIPYNIISPEHHYNSSYNKLHDDSFYNHNDHNRYSKYKYVIHGITISRVPEWIVWQLCIKLLISSLDSNYPLIFWQIAFFGFDRFLLFLSTLQGY